MFVFTTEHTGPGAPHVRNWYDIMENAVTGRVRKKIPRSLLAGEYCNGAQMIDVHSHLGQGLLYLEHELRT